MTDKVDPYAAITPTLTDEERAEWRKRYASAAHGVQSSVAFSLSRGSEGGSPKHLRTGLDLRAAESAGLAELLVRKGLITDDEYMQAVVIAVEKECSDRADDVSRALGTNVTFQ